MAINSQFIVQASSGGNTAYKLIISESKIVFVCTVHWVSSSAAFSFPFAISENDRKCLRRKNLTRRQIRSVILLLICGMQEFNVRRFFARENW